MLADGEIVGDGSWNLTIYVTDLSEKRTMVVKGDMHIGGVMLKLTESFDFKVSKPMTIPTKKKLPNRSKVAILWIDNGVNFIKPFFLRRD
ncbi:unnamed protein product [Euphydryas editha]|uniref:Kindlin-2 N-terminal domain-containing protein n=1 Tax=Euphydryas editha TaxID=104508 RepID=A0AAU9U8S1_EUPED|nr:unnamed protein product [Euphydryas editha]